MKQQNKMPEPKLKYAQLSDASFVRPSLEISVRLRKECHDHVLQVFPPGDYEDVGKINAALKRGFEFYSERLKRLLTQLASRDLIQFLLFQYDETARIGHGDQLEEPERRIWLDDGVRFRRAVKHLCEITSLVAQRADSDLSQSKTVKLFDQALLCAEEMVQLYHFSEVTYSLFPEDTRFKISLDYGKTLLVSPQTGLFPKYGEIIEKDRKNRSRFIGGLTIDVNPPAVCKVLDDYFTRGFGISFSHFLDFIKHAIEDPLPAPEGFPIPFINREDLINAGTSFGIDRKVIRQILAGFTVAKQAMELEGRAMWNPKQKHRAMRRAIFEFPYPTGTHLVWSKGMAKECFTWMLSGTCFQQLPEEWLNTETKDGLAEMSNVAGTWFEKVAVANLQSVGIAGRDYKGEIRAGAKSIRIPNEVGQLDFIGYSAAENLIVLAEFKMVEENTEPKFFRDAIAQFVRKTDNYSDRFLKKIRWFKENQRQIADTICPSAVSPKTASVMITLYPSFAAFFIKEFPCVSITHFRLDYEIRGVWPYEL